MIFCSETEYKNQKEVKNAYPEAAVIKKACGGWCVFESYGDYATWKKQK